MMSSPSRMEAAIAATPLRHEAGFWFSGANGERFHAKTVGALVKRGALEQRKVPIPRGAPWTSEEWQRLRRTEWVAAVD